MKNRQLDLQPKNTPSQISTCLFVTLLPYDVPSLETNISVHKTIKTPKNRKIKSQKFTKDLAMATIIARGDGQKTAILKSITYTFGPQNRGKPVLALSRVLLLDWSVRMCFP